MAASTAWILLDRAAAAACGIFSLIIMSRSLGAEGLGHLAVAQSFVPLFLFLADWGIGTSAVAELSRKPGLAGRILGTAILMRLPLCACAWSACLLVARLLGYGEARFMEILIFSAILWLPVVESVSVVFPAALRMRAPSIISVAASVLQLVLVALCAALGLGVPAFLAALVGAMAVRSLGTAAVALRMGRARLAADRHLARSLLRSGTLLSGAALFTLATNGLPILVLERLHGAAEAGLYSVGARVLVILYTLPLALMTTVLPLMARELQQDPRRFLETYRRTRNLLFWLAVPVGLGATLLGGTAVRLVFGSGFSGAVTPFSILLWQPVLVFPWIAASNALIAQKREKANLLLVAMTAILTVAACAALIPSLGAAGAAVASVVNFVPVALVSLLMVSRPRPLPRPLVGAEAPGAGFLS